VTLMVVCVNLASLALYGYVLDDRALVHAGLLNCLKRVFSMFNMT
jgi:hypothetical protein